MKNLIKTSSEKLCWGQIWIEVDQERIINSYIWNLERSYQQSFVQVSKEDTDINNKLLDPVWKEEGGMIWENSIETYTLPYVK